MTTILRLLSGESTRTQMEGVKTSEMLRIMSEPANDDDSSPFAEVLGAHIYATDDVSKKKTSIKMKKKKKR